MTRANVCKDAGALTGDGFWRPCNYTGAKKTAAKDGLCRKMHECQSCDAYVAVSPKPAPARTELTVVAPEAKPGDVCRHRSEKPTGEVECQTCAGSVSLKVFDCAVHKTCTIKKKIDGHGSCHGCTDRDDGSPVPSAGTVVIDHGAGGIGDGLLGLLSVAALPGPVEYRVSGLAQPFVALFDGYATLGRHARPHSESPVPGARQLNAGYRAENAQKYPIPRWERYAANAGAAGVKLPSLREPERIRPLAGYLSGVVALCPFSTDPAREWSLQHWLSLESLLLRRGYRVAVLHDKPGPLKPFAGEKVAGQSAEMVASILLNAKCAIGTDSGLSHLAGILGTPTVVMGGSTPAERIFGAYPRVTCLQGGLVCSGCCGGTGVTPTGGGWTDRCKVSCGNLQSIAPERVLAEVDRIWLKETLTCDTTGCRTLLTPDRLASLRDLILATNHLPGDTAELGTYLGGSAKLIRHYATGTLRLFDTFAGIPGNDEDPGGHHRHGEFACGLEEVRSFVGAEGIVYHPGAFPTGFEPTDTRYRFVHLDADTYQSTAAALAYFAPKMVSGGLIAMDDYGWHACPGVARAVREAGLSATRTVDYQAVIRF